MFVVSSQKFVYLTHCVCPCVVHWAHRLIHLNGSSLGGRTVLEDEEEALLEQVCHLAVGLRFPRPHHAHSHCLPPACGQDISHCCSSTSVSCCQDTHCSVVDSPQWSRPQLMPSFLRCLGNCHATGQ